MSGGESMGRISHDVVGLGAGQCKGSMAVQLWLAEEVGGAAVPLAISARRPPADGAGPESRQS